MGEKKSACCVRCRKSIRDAKDANDGVGLRFESSGFLEFDFDGVAEGVEEAGAKGKLETRRQMGTVASDEW